MKLYVYFLVGWLILASCELFESGPAEPSMQDSYEITQGACGTVEMQQKLGRNFNEALAILESVQSKRYSRSCPDAPCHDIRLNPYELEVEDHRGNIPDAKFQAIRVEDLQTDLIVHGVVDVLTSNGYYYRINWCPEAPPVSPPDD